ncbi:MAG TPA: polysaccharide biosynthesis protein [Erysipelothrix sp.]|nr:polysaccharide biosynthesis protein [Erysipelothrix sp.]
MLRIRRKTLLVLDILFIFISFAGANLLKFGVNDFQRVFSFAEAEIWVLLLIHISFFIIFDLYNRIWQNAGFIDYFYVVVAFVIASFVSLIYAVLSRNINYTTLVIFELLLFLMVLGARFYFRIENRLKTGRGFTRTQDKKRVLIIGAGEAASLVVKEIERRPDLNMEVLGLVDDDPEKIGSQIRGYYVMGTRDDMSKLVVSRGIDEVIFAIPSISASEKREIINKVAGLKVNIKTVPGVYEMVEQGLDMNSIRDVEISDLLGRTEVQMNSKEIAHYINNKTILVTGGGGSIGSELCRQIAAFNPRKLVILDIYENNAYDIQIELSNRFRNLSLDVIIASVRDEERINYIFEEIKPDIVFHAAAHKHVPLMERSPEEAIKNNVFGTLNVGRASIKNNVEKFILISTDKAVNPTNVMGASKRMCEMIIQILDKESETDFVAVRFGNVLGSNGSVIPLFKKQIQSGGPVTVTHKDITRYFMTIPEAVSLVLQAGYYADGGEIFVLDMGEPVRIYELAENLIRLSGFEPNVDMKIEVTGLRPGEKLFEELLMDEEGMKETPNHLIKIGKPIELDETEFSEQLTKLNAIAHEKNINFLELKRAIAEIVPTYKFHK